jgi:hypothetical protein
MDLVDPQRIDRIERQLANVYDHSGLDAEPGSRSRRPPEVHQLVRSGHQACPLGTYCEATGADLATGHAPVKGLADGRSRSLLSPRVVVHAEPRDPAGPV